MDSNAPPPSAAPTAIRFRAKGLLVFLAKATVTVTLIAWLIRSDSLELSKLRILVDSPRVLLVTCCAWLFVTMGLTTWRWRILLEAVGPPVPALRAAALQTTALFFNGLVPGNVGGDFIKNQAVMGNQAMKIFVLVLVERTVGLVSLIWAATLGLLLSVQQVMQHKALAPVAATILILALGSVFGPWFLLTLVKVLPGLKSGEGTSSAGFFASLRRLTSSALEAFQLVRAAKRKVAKGLLVSFFMHLGNIAYFLFLTRELGNPAAQFSEVAMVFPLGMLTLVLPISISGLGVGHVIFNELFRILGLRAGASIFNVYIVAQLTPCLLGAIPYLFMKSRASTRLDAST